MKKLLFITVLIFILFNAYSQRIVKTTEDCYIYDSNMNIINMIKKNEDIEISKYYFEYLNNGNNFNYYTGLNTIDETYIESSKLQLIGNSEAFPNSYLTKSGDCFFIKEYFQSLEQKNVSIVYNYFSKTIEENLNNYDYSDWTRGVAFYQKNSYLMNIEFSFQSYYLNFTGSIKNISKINGMYKLSVINYFYTNSSNTNTLINQKIKQNGDEETFYLKVDGDYLSFYLSDGKTLIQTFIRTNEVTKNEFEKFLKTGKYNESKIRWPRHADGTCDYDGSSKNVTTANNSQTKSITLSTNVTVNKTMVVKENLKLRSGEATSSQVLTVMSSGQR